MSPPKDRGPIAALKAALEQRARTSRAEMNELATADEVRAPSQRRDADHYRDWALRVRTSGETVTLSDLEAELIAREATADCVLSRAYLLRASGHVAAGLALQRQGWRLARSAADRMALTFEAAGDDDEFRRLVATADEARDRSHWSAAAGHYERALQLYPLHHGYRVQYAHMLKEQDMFAAAEVHYRSARTLGAPAADIDRHLEYVGQRQGQGFPPTVPLGVPSNPMEGPPSHLDVEALAYAIWQSPHVPEPDMLWFLRTCRSCEDVAVLMIEDERFLYRSGPLLSLIGARA